MEKVWFKLRQMDYPPPTEESMGTDKETSPICLGHFIPDLKRIDFVLNRHQIEEFPDNMPVYPTTAIKFKWENSKESETGGQIGGSVPIVAAAGITVGASLQLLFRSKITNYEEYDRLDKYIVQINKSYVSDCVATIPSLAEHTNRHDWTMFVITGLMVARGATKIAASESSGVEAGGGPQVEIPGVASVTATAKITRTQERKMRSSGASDFVFAVRLARVHKGILQADWSLDRLTKKATFTTKGENIDVPVVLSSEGLDGFSLVEDENLGYDFVIGSQDSPQKGGSTAPENA
ncbi:hypothetical protein B0A49_07279 [Cryomyces minteri]|uniref:Uncharacterized protein n=1 Tax=Cryomyces minteri TaxID=331657 RepID=A0A4U0WVG2_9PEZI|nr:hypothetical protein B0A49_07279 [Cryomyces minteri]